MNKENLQKMIDEGFISVQKHPTEDLYIYNYTPSAQYGRMWNEETLNCRGLIMDGQGNIKARPFRKFFNIEEHQEVLPNGKFEVFDKLDGSLGILYWLGTTPVIATRGSFTSDQAQKANEMLYTKYRDYWFWLQPENTYLFEIVYPANRIVVDYGKVEELILLTIIETATGKELPIDGTPFPFVQRYDGLTDLSKLKELEKENSEGFVIRWENNFRLKFKFDEYKRLHRLLTQVSAKSIWENLMAKSDLKELLEKVPDEFYNWVKSTARRLVEQYTAIEEQAKYDFDQMPFGIDRKEFAFVAKDKKYPAILFRMLDGKSYEEIIWKMIKPAFEKPFKQDEI